MNIKPKNLDPESEGYRPGAPNAYDGIYDEGENLNGQSQEEREEEEIKEGMKALVASLERRAQARVERRVTWEKRALEDLAQYHGKYNSDLEQLARRQKKSTIFINQTRTKTDAMIARLFDLLFPTDDRNWGVEPTVVPSMSDKLEGAILTVDEAKELEERLMQEGIEQDQEGVPEAVEATAEEIDKVSELRKEAEKKVSELQELAAEAKRRANLMQDEIDDQLKACNYPREVRRAIEDACKIGIGVIKGPVVGGKLVPKYGANGVVRVEPEKRPGAYWVDPWGFFPDPDANTPEDSDGFFERELMNKKQMRKLSREPGIDRDAMREVMRDEPKSGDMPWYYADLQGLTGQSGSSDTGLYAVWEYTGALEPDEIILISKALGDDSLLEDANIDPNDTDPLEEVHCKIWFCQGQMLRFALHPLDTNEEIYSVFNLVEDEVGMFGFGVPYIIREPQAMLNAAVRMMMDNARLAIGPQVVVNKDAVTPQDGHWRFYSEKIWIRNNATAAGAGGAPPFETFDIPMRQAEINNIIELSMRFIDEVTGMPRLAQGEQGTGVTKTAQGMAILMNSANVMFRRIIRNFDDNMTVPLIRRFYHWNMQFSDREDIKGDYEVDARGSSVLLVREMQASNLVTIAQMFSGTPLGERIKDEGLMRQIFKAHMLNTAELVMTDREMAEKQEAAGQDPMAMAAMAEMQLKEKTLEVESQRIEMEAAKTNTEWQTRLEIARMELDFDSKKLAVDDENADKDRELAVAKANQSANDKTQAQLIRERDHNAKRKDDREKMKIEAAMAERTGRNSGGSI